MRLVADTNRIIAALVRNSSSRKILLSNKFKFLTVDFTKTELEEHRQELLEKTKLNQEQLNTVLTTFFEKITVISDTAVESAMDQAKKIMDAVDPDDTPFIALALAVKSDGIWSDDVHFSKQSKIKVWSTKDLTELIKKEPT